MPMQRDLYPADWEELSRRIRFERAGGACEWCGAVHGAIHPETGSRVILTVNCTRSGLRASSGSNGRSGRKSSLTGCGIVRQAPGAAVAGPRLCEYGALFFNRKVTQDCV